MSSICLVDILHVPKPLEKSCFTEKQIDLIFNQWKLFKQNKLIQDGLNPENAKQHINDLYTEVISSKQKYDIIKFDKTQKHGSLLSKERSWVMPAVLRTSETSDFIRFIRNNASLLNDDLKMAFKPNLSGDNSLTSENLIDILIRYQYWLNSNPDKTINLLRISAVWDEKYVQGSELQTIENLKSKWTSARFHIALLQAGEDDKQWKCVLIDKKLKTFEYYDPYGQSANIMQEKGVLSDVLRTLYDTVSSLIDIEPSNIKMYEKVRRGFKSNTKDCGAYVLWFIHTRIIHNHTFEQYINQDLSMVKCQKLRHIFYHVPETLNNNEINQQNDKKTKRKLNKNYGTKYGAFEYRLAALNYYEYLKRVKHSFQTNVSNRPMSTQYVDNVNRFMDDLDNVSTSPSSSYYDIKSKGFEISKRLENIMSQYNNSTNNTTLHNWEEFIDEILQDTFTDHLRNVGKSKHKNKQNRAHKTDREKIAKQIYLDIIKWADMPQINREIYEQQLQVEQLLINMYVPYILAANNTDQNRFELDMPSEAFLKQTMARKEYVSFGVHFLRTLEKWIAAQHIQDFDLNNVLNVQFPKISNITKPFIHANQKDLVSIFNKCEDTIREAKNILSNFITHDLKHQQQQQPLVNYQQHDAFSNHTDDFINDIINNNEYTFRNNLFYKNNTLDPWNFPVNLELYNQMFPKEANELTNNFIQQQDIDQQDIQVLLQSKKFKTFYAMGIFMMINYMKYNTIPNLHISLIATSLTQFYDIAKLNTYSDDQIIICYLLSEFSKASKQRPIVSNMLYPYEQACFHLKQNTNTNTFFYNVEQEQNNIINKLTNNV